MSKRGLHVARLSSYIGALIAVVCLAVVGLTSSSSAATTVPGSRSDPPLVSDPAAYVNPFIGTGSGGPVVGSVATFPGAATPSGMLTWSPATLPSAYGSGYNYTASKITGFPLTHFSGAGCGRFGDIPILPTVGSIGSDPRTKAEPFSHAHEHVSAGHYGVTLAPGTNQAIQSQLSVTTRTGIGRFTFPATKQANFLFKVGDSQNKNVAASVRILGNSELEGSATSPLQCGVPNTYTVYFAAQFDRPFSSYGTWDGSSVTPARQVPPTPESKAPQPQPTSASVSGANSGAWVTFDTTAKHTVHLKVAISYVSEANAWSNLRAEDPGWSFSAVQMKAVAAWNRLLGRVQVGGGTHSEKVQFYTALYHTMLEASVFSDANGQYFGFDNKVHQLPAGQVQYANIGCWDRYRSATQLTAILAPRRSSQIMASLLNDQAQGGWLPKLPGVNGYTGVMGGDSCDAVLSEAYAFGARDFNTKAALAAMLKGATQVPTSLSQLGQGFYVERPGLSSYEKLGYVPSGVVAGRSASVTLEYATDDFAIAQMAKALGQDSTYATFLARSQNWTNIFDSTASYGGFQGFIKRRNANGSFSSGPVFYAKGFGQRGFEEGNTVQYTWMVPQDLHGLFSAMGGNAVVVKRLNALFTHLNLGPDQPYYWAGNEVGLEVPWEYDYAGAPYKTQAVVHKILASVYSNTPSGEPGNDDGGAMSSWLVWAYLGMYPETPGTPVLALGAPVFPKVVLHLARHHTVTISAAGTSPTSYVQSLAVNGKPWAKDWLPASVITGSATTTSAQPASPAVNPGGGQYPAGPTTLSFTMATSPNASWAATQADEPPSYPSGPITLPSSASLAASPTIASVSPGSTATETIQLDNSLGQGPLVVNWKATSTGSLSVSPASGSLSAPAGQDATATVTLSAPSDAANAIDQVTVSGTASDGSALPPIDVPVAVAPPGNILRDYNNVGIADFAHQACANFDGQHSGYSASQLAAAGLEPGATVHANGVTFTWPDVATCQLDNVRAAGQTVAVTHAAKGASELAFLGAGGTGNSSGPVTIHYTDGTTSTATLGFSDWALDGGTESPKFGNQIVATMPYHYKSGKYAQKPVHVFEAAIPVNRAKTVASVTLPQASQVSGGSLHIFALGVG